MAIFSCVMKMNKHDQAGIRFLKSQNAMKEAECTSDLVLESTKDREVASQVDCVCQIAAHEGHGSAFFHTIGTSTDGDGTWKAPRRAESMRGNLATEGAFVIAFCCAARKH